MFFGDSRTALIFAESVYFKTKLSVIPTGIFDFLLICFISSKLLSHERVNAKTNKIFKKFFNCYKDGTVTESPIQHLKEITLPALPSVNISVFVGALPS